MKLLVTGARGFIGSHLCAELREAGHHVAGVDQDEGDLRIGGVADWLIKTTRPDMVVHLAAKVGRLFGEDDVMETVTDNAGMTARVAQACGDAGVRLAYASTSEIYGDTGPLYAVEEQSAHPSPMLVEAGELLPHNLYGLSKRWGEEVCELYAPKGLTVFRFSMPYGPGLPAGRGRAAIINMLWQAHHGMPIPVHAGAERSWCWIGDTVRGARMILESGKGGVWNVGRDDNATSMLTVAHMACALTGADPALIAKSAAGERQTLVKRLSMDKLRGLGWEPTVELREGMERLVPWIKNFDVEGNRYERIAA